MDDMNGKTRELIEEVCRERLDIFTRTLETGLASAGVDQAIIDAALSRAVSEVRREFSDRTDRVIQRAENRRIDSLGRLLVEYCFLRSPKAQMLWPENSDQDLRARREFVADIVPRPLMRYFLISVRGTLETLDQFHSPSLLFSDNGQEYNQLRAEVNERLNLFKGPFGSGESQVDWEGVYEDRGFQILALKIIETMRHRLDEFGLETYLSHLNHYRCLDPASRGINAMHRSLSLEDARQLEHALEFAEGVLWQISQ